MKILLTGATGYIGKRLLPILLHEGHQVVCLVRDSNRFNPPAYRREQIEIIECDLLDISELDKIPSDIEAAYYLVHSMSSSKDYATLESKSAHNFREVLESTRVKHVIYLSGIINEQSLSKHLSSRRNVENVLGEGNYNLTTLRAGIIIGSGSASFEIIRDLVEKLPVMVTPKWLNTRCQPIGVKDIIHALVKSLMNEETFNRSFDIGGPDILSYKQMLLGFAALRGLRRTIITLPVMSPRLSSYWLYFVTATSYKLAIALVDSMKIEVVCKDDQILRILGLKPNTYHESLQSAFQKIEANQIISSWKDSFVSGRLNFNVSDLIEVPIYGCFLDRRSTTFNDFEKIAENLWKIGGSTGWYHADLLWKLRGFLDKLVGGVGLRRGRTHQSEISVGDVIDFWRVLYADKEECRLLLYAEMKLPGEAWLEFRTKGNEMIQTATFRPRGVWGRLYWYSIYPLHGFVFKGMLSKLTA